MSDSPLAPDRTPARTAFYFNFKICVCVYVCLFACWCDPQSRQSGHYDRNSGYAILGLIVVSGLRWQHADCLHAISL